MTFIRIGTGLFVISEDFGKRGSLYAAEVLGIDGSLRIAVSSNKDGPWRIASEAERSTIGIQGASWDTFIR